MAAVELQKRLMEARTRLQSRIKELRKRIPVFQRMGYYSHSASPTQQGAIVQSVIQRTQEFIKALEPYRPLNIARRMAQRAGLKVQIPPAPKLGIGAGAPPSPAPPPPKETGAGLAMKRKFTGGL